MAHVQTEGTVAPPNLLYPQPLLVLVPIYLVAHPGNQNPHLSSLPHADVSSIPFSKLFSHLLSPLCSHVTTFTPVSRDAAWTLSYLDSLLHLSPL